MNTMIIIKPIMDNSFVVKSEITEKLFNIVLDSTKRLLENELDNIKDEVMQDRMCCTLDYPDRIDPIKLMEIKNEPIPDRLKNNQHHAQQFRTDVENKIHDYLQPFYIGSETIPNSNYNNIIEYIHALFKYEIYIVHLKCYRKKGRHCSNSSPACCGIQFITDRGYTFEFQSPYGDYDAQRVVPIPTSIDDKQALYIIAENSKFPRIPKGCNTPDMIKGFRIGIQGSDIDAKLQVKNDNLKILLDIQCREEEYIDNVKEYDARLADLYSEKEAFKVYVGEATARINRNLDSIKSKRKNLIVREKALAETEKIYNRNIKISDIIDKIKHILLEMEDKDIDEDIIEIEEMLFNINP